jgi:hypothetical protein
MGDDAARQAAWDKEVTAEEQAGTIKPGQFSHTYPGDAAAMTLANNFALGSQLVKEQQENRRISLDAWKPLQGQLVNMITGEKIGANLNVDQLNQAFQSRWQINHPGEPLPDQFKLKPDATPEDFARMDKVLEGTERATLTKKEKEVADAMRAQTYEMAREKADMHAVIGTDPKTGNPVLVPFSQAQQMGIQNPLQASDDQTNKAIAARHWLQLANKQAPATADPSDMGIRQLIDTLDSQGKLGPLASRWNDFRAGKWGAGDPYYKALDTKLGLSSTLLMQAHAGNKGGSFMLEHFEDLANDKKLDGPTLKAGFNSEVNYVTDRAMDPNPPNWNAPAKSTLQRASAIPRPSNATMEVPGSDGRMHWSDGKQDLGISR